MEQEFYRGRLEGDYGLKVVTPDAAERDYINDVIFDELCAGVFKPQSRRRFEQIIDRLVKEEGAEGVILGCTEIPLLMKETDVTCRPSTRRGCTPPPRCGTPWGSDRAVATAAAWRSEACLEGAFRAGVRPTTRLVEGVPARVPPLRGGRSSAADVDPRGGAAAASPRRPASSALVFGLSPAGVAADAVGQLA